ncbi:MAG: hypothetical protein HQ567_12980 [Candidatus Nealsonbacteria bacterium]|nr:hypothetical protein [Candidatus Nealsonbacteria bacterium]
MDNRPNADERLLEAIEACRGSDDVADPALTPLAERLSDDPQLAELYERLQQTDASITEAFCDVPVPEGLDQRILERLAAAPVDPAEPATVAKPRSRRWFQVVGIGATVTAVAVSLAVFLQPPDIDLTETAARQQAIDAFQSDWPNNGQWPEQGQAVTDDVLQKFPISRGMALPPSVRMQWRNVKMFGASGVAYDMIDRQGRTATLYVVGCTLPGLRNAPPRAPAPGTAGCVTASWCKGGLLYVLVVRGGGREYESFVPPANLT